MERETKGKERESLDAKEKERKGRARERETYGDRIILVKGIRDTVIIAGSRAIRPMRACVKCNT